jgi:protein SCO1/2
MALTHEGLPATHPDHPAPLSRTTKLILLGLLGLGLLILVAVLWFTIAQPVQVLPRIRALPSFVLQDQYGLPLHESDLRGRMVLINFTYTGCTDACAAQREALVTLRETLRADGRFGRELIFLTISFDPERDSSLVLQTYAAQLGAERNSWRFATGDPTELKALIGGELGIYYGLPDATGRIEHEQQLLLIDGNGQLRARYDGQVVRQERLLRDLGMIREELGSSGLMRQIYEASHLFLCYPPD